MKKIIVLVSIMLASFVLSTLFFFSSGFFDFTYGYVTNETVKILNQDLDNLFLVRFSNQNCEKTTIDETISLNLSDISMLKISSLSTDIEIIETTSEYATAYLYGTGCDHRLISSKTSNIQNIYIEYPAMNGWFSQIRTNLEMKIYIPETYKESIDVSSVSGEIKFREASQKECDFSTVSGDIFLGDFNCEESNIKTTSGEVEIDNGTFTEIKTVSGDIFLSNVLFKTKSNIVTVSGDVELYGMDSSNLKINFNSISGEAEGKTVYGSEDKVLSVKTTSGDLEIN